MLCFCLSLCFSFAIDFCCICSLLAALRPLLAALWPLLAALGLLLGALGPLLAALGLLLGRSWALLGGSWEALGGSWPLLGRSWNDIKKSSKNRCQKCQILAPKRAPKGNQNRTPNRPNSKTKIDAKKNDVQDRLEGVLGRSWAVL